MLNEFAPAGHHDGQAAPVADEEIRQRAFEIYQERGCSDGHALDDWLQAETEIKPRSSVKVLARE